VERFARGAGDDSLDRAARVFSVPAEPIAPTRIREWARSIGVSEVAAAFAPVGRAAAALGQAGVALEREGIRLVQLRRDFDQLSTPGENPPVPPASTGTICGVAASPSRSPT
jgi:hypothetical protein